MVRRIGGESAARNDHAIVKLGDGRRAGDESRGRADRWGEGRIIESGVEDDHISPDGVIGNDDGVARTQGEGQFLAELPGILTETLPHVATENGISPVADFRITVEQTQGGVGYRSSGRREGVTRPDEVSAVVTKAKLPVLVVRALAMVES